MVRARLFTRDFALDTMLSMFCSLNYFTLLINIVGYATITFGATSSEAGLAAGLYVIGGLVSRFLFGKYIELVGRKRVLILGLIASLVMSASYFFISSLAMLYVVRFIHGLAYGITSTCSADIIAKLIPAGRRTEGLGYFYLGVTLSMAVGPFLGMQLGATGDYNLVFAVGLIMYTLATVCALLIHVPEETLSDEQKKEARSFTFDNLVQVSAIPLAVTCMIFYFAYSGVLSFISAYSGEIGMSETANYFYLVAAFGTLISRFTTGRLCDTKGPNIVMIPGFASFAIAMYAFSQTSDPVVFLVSAFFMGYGISIIYAVCQSIVIAQNPPHRYGVTSSTFSAISDMGSGLGPSILGMLIASMGFRDMYLVCVVVSLVSLVMYWTIHGRHAKTRP